MSEAEKKVTFEKVMATRKSIREQLSKYIPEDLLLKIKDIPGDVQISKFLADNGIDIENVEEKIKTAYKDITDNLTELSQDELAEISGGFHDRDYRYDVKCCCGNNNEDDFSYQFWASAIFSNGGIYRCKKCGHYVEITAEFELTYYNEEQYARRMPFGILR